MLGDFGSYRKGSLMNAVAQDAYALRKFEYLRQPVAAGPRGAAPGAGRLPIGADGAPAGRTGAE